jgi:hypothetical protein
MYARVVRFTDVDPDHMAGRLDEVEASEGPPVDIPAKGIQILHDPDQRTAVVIQLFETADDMAAADVVHHDPYDPNASGGLEGLKKTIAMNRAAFPDMRIDIEDQVAEGDKVTTRWTAMTDPRCVL